MELFAYSDSIHIKETRPQPAQSSQRNIVSPQTLGLGYQGITASEYACEGEFVEEAALPVPSEPRNLEAAKPNATDMFLILSEGPTTLCLDCQSESSQVESGQSSSNGGTETGPSVNSSMTTSANDLQEQEQTGYGTDRSMDGDLSEEQGFFISSAQEDRTSREHSTMSRVLDDLDGILRDKINLEVEEFRQNLQSLLDEQQNRIHHLIQLSTEDTPQQILQSEEAAGIATAMEDYEDDHHNRVTCEGEMAKYRNLLLLLTYASAISGTLRRQEFHVM